MTPEFSLRENSDVVPPAEGSVLTSLAPPLEGPTTEFFGGPLPENSVVSGFISLLHEKSWRYHRRRGAEHSYVNGSAS